MRERGCVRERGGVCVLFVWYVLCVCNGDDVCVFVLVCMYMCMCVYIMYVCVYFCACVCVCAHVIHTHTCMHTL